MSGRLLSLALLVFVIATLSAAPGQAAEKRITVTLNNTTVRDALVAVFEKANVSYVLKEGITGNIESLSFRDERLETVLKTIAKTANLTYSVEDGIYIVGPKQASEETQEEKPAPSGSAAGTAPVSAPEGQPILPSGEAATPEAAYSEQGEPYGGLYTPYWSPYLGYWYPYYPPFEYGGVIHSPWPGPIIIGQPPIRTLAPVAPWAPWRGPAPTINGRPIY